MYPKQSVSTRLTDRDNYLVVHGYDNECAMLSCFTRADTKKDGRGSAVKIIPNELKDQVVRVFKSSGYVIFDRTQEDKS